ncbi:serine O-acetyltransferase EpsC [Blattabacterium cuenoti]|uniref:serine O-acetyltransferase EpsC n=1 Tax=Blattabacterium cuenoti TaxID=1653831 RepID=UPI00163D020F|nr:serine O-acetyltransferase EpsC [Blattabacterium cuenoti]
MINSDFLKNLFEEKNRQKKFFPNKKKFNFFLERLFHILFTPDFSLLKNNRIFEEKYKKLHKILYSIFIELNLSSIESKNYSEKFFEKVPDIYYLLLRDADAILKTDPAATSIEEIFLTYPGFFAIASYRIAHQFWNQKIPIIPRIITEYAHSKTGVDIHAGAEIGCDFSIDHGTGVVIGSSTKIGNEVKIYQGVTLGAIYVDKKLSNMKRHPTIEDKVTIYSGATVLGGDTTIGHHSILGGNVWVTKSIPPYSIVYQKNEIMMKNSNYLKKSIDFTI